MGIIIEWFRVGPRTAIRVDINGGVLSLAASSRLLNYADYGWNPAEVTGAVYKNGTQATSLSFDSADGDITCNTVNVQQGDVIEVRVEYGGKFSWPWHNKMIARRSAWLTVPAGNTTVDFDDNNHKQPVPGFELGYGWDSNNKLKVGVKVASADGASQAMTLYSRRLPSAQESSTSIDLSSANVQEHTSTFSTSDITGDFELEWTLYSGGSEPRQQDRVRLQFHAKELVADYPPGFPGDNVSLVQSRASDRLKLGAPGQ